ncbi:MAG: PHP domain-containing protein [Solirubrobacterales bacterium]
MRAAFHVHSEWSYDATLPLEQVAALFRRHRYDVVFMCEHDRGFSSERLHAYLAACARASAGGPLLIGGIEYADPEDRVHVPVWGSVPFQGEGVPTARLLAAVARHGGVSVLAHPLRRDAWEVVDPAWLSLCTGVEIWTRKWDGWAPNPRACRWAADHALLGIAALDLHRPTQTFPLAMELDVAPPLTVEGCLDALRRRRCRATIAGLPAAPLTKGALAPAARATERLRRPLWRRARHLRERLAAAS